MIIEFIKHLLTPAPKAVKGLGFVAEAIAIDARYTRCKNQWQGHLDNCRKIIMAEAEKLSPSAHIVILGAGSLHDLPFTKLAQRGHHLSLLDIIFLNHSRKKIRRMKNVTLIEADITNYAEPFYKWIQKSSDPLPEVTKPPALDGLLKQKPDLIISLNILSQLPIQFEEKAAKLRPTLKFNKQEQELIKQHINWLNKQTCPSLLIADMRRITMDGTREVNAEAIAGIDTLGEPLQTWRWDIAPAGEADKRLSLWHQVGAWWINP